jgi:hypothetical protein|nr:hypothetical protein [Neorhizobium tomejilense]
MQQQIDFVLSRIAVPADAEKRAHVVAMVLGMLTHSRSPSPGSGSEKPGRAMHPEDVVRNLEGWGFNDWNQRLAWIRRDGFVMPTVDFHHEYVLHYLGLDVVTVEDQGWARISNSGWQCLYRVSPQQRRSLKARGCEIDSGKERLKKQWHGLPPFDDSVPLAYRIPR